MTSELPSHGTGYMESEAFMDVVVLFNTFAVDGQAPDFTFIQKRLHDGFNLSELRNLDIIAKTLANLIDAELALRGSESDYKHFDDPQH